MSRNAGKYCLTSTSYLTELFVVSILFYIRQNFVCFGELLWVWTLCDASHGVAWPPLPAFLDISWGTKLTMLGDGRNLLISYINDRRPQRCPSQKISVQVLYVFDLFTGVLSKLCLCNLQFSLQIFFSLFFHLSYFFLDNLSKRGAHYILFSPKQLRTLFFSIFLAFYSSFGKIFIGQ